jgi:hypothetical protein
MGGERKEKKNRMDGRRAPVAFNLFLFPSLPGLRRVEVDALDPVGPLGEAALLCEKRREREG